MIRDLGLGIRIRGGRPGRLDLNIRGQPPRVFNALDDELMPLRAGMDAVAFAQPLDQQMPQIAFPGEVFGRVEDRVMQLAKLDFHVALFRHLEGVCHRLGCFGEPGLHFRSRAEIKLLVQVLHPLRICQQRLGADADQAIMRVRMRFLEVMNIVGGDKFHSKLTRKRNKLPVHLGLLWQTVILQLQVEVLRAQRLLEPIDRFPGFRHLVLENGLGDFACQAGRERDETFLVGG